MSISTYSRKRIEIIVDHPHLSRVLQLLDARDIQGYTVMASTSGKGSRGPWRASKLTDADDRVVVLAVTEESKSDGVLEDLSRLFTIIPGVVFVSEVEVLRSERF